MQDGRLWDLAEAGILLSSDLQLDTVLRRIVEVACCVVGATYGALGVIGQDRSGLSTFVHHGLSEDQARRIGSPPRGRGLLGALIDDPRPIRLDDLTTDPRAHGFPEHHPQMKSFLGLPVVSKGRVFGNLYLCDRKDGGPFTEADERMAVVLAAQAGVAIENSELYEQARSSEARAWGERERIQAEAELAESRLRTELRAQAVRDVLRAQEKERSRIARELHDSFGQSLASVLLGLKVAEQERTLHDMRARLADLREVVASAAAEVRRIAFELRPTVLDDLGLAVSLERLVGDAAERTGIDVVSHIRLSTPRLDPDVETVSYRVAQEALTNAIKSARPTTVHLSLDDSNGALQLTVRDDGCGFDPESVNEGLGLLGMRERASLVGGVLTISSAPGRGTTVRLEVSLPTAASSASSLHGEL